MTPKISAYCLTFRTPELLEEALQSFLMQDYAGEKELIILNDEPTQTLVFNHPQVRIYNMPSRCADIVSKYNHAVSLCSGDICLPWDDDDICLPHRMSSVAATMRGGLWFSNQLFTDPIDNELSFTVGNIHNNHAFTKDHFIRFGTYQETEELGYDFRFMAQLREMVKQQEPIQEVELPSYVYRKRSTNRPNHSNHIGRNPDNHYETYAEALSEWAEGTILLSPRWERDWSGMALKNMASKPLPLNLHDVDEAFPQQEDTLSLTKDGETE